MSEQFSISLELLRVMFSFVDILGKPNATTIEEFFTLEWELKNNTEVVLRFRDNLVIDYLLILPNPNIGIKKREILHGSKSYIELLQYIQEKISK